MVTTRSSVVAAAKNKRDDHFLMFEELVPSSGWSEDLNTHLLIIDLPGFHVGEVKLHIDDFGRIVAKGERQVSENKHIRFEQSFEIPENSNTDDTTAKFDDEILYIIIPKIKKTTTTEENQHQTPLDDAEILHGDSQENAPEELTRRDMSQNGTEMTGNGENDKKFHDLRFACKVYDESSLRKVGLKLKRHKGLIITAILAFFLGLFVSNKFQSNQK